MNLESAIEHIKNQGLPNAPENEKATWVQVLGWLMELKWYRDGKPFPPEVDTIKQNIEALFPELHVDVGQPKYMNGIWNLDMDCNDRHSINIVFNRKQDKCWGVSEIDSNDNNPMYGEGPNKVFTTIEETLVEVQQIFTRERRK